MSQVKSQSLVCSGHTRPIPQIAFSALQPTPGFLLISSCKDGKAMLREGMTGDWLGTFLGHKGAVWSGKLCEDGTKAVTGSADFTAKVWDTYTGTATLTLSHNHIVRAVDISPKGSHIITGGQEKKLRLFDLEKPDSPTFFIDDKYGDLAHGENIKSVVYNDVNNAIISADDKTLVWWDIRSNKPTSRQEYAQPIASFDRSPSSTVLSVCTGNTIHFLSPNNTPISSHTLAYAPSCASLHPNGETYVTGSNDGWIRVHSSKGGDEKENELYKGHHGPVHSISYSPDGELFASGSEDGTIRLHQDRPKTYGLWRFEGDS